MDEQKERAAFEAWASAQNWIIDKDYSCGDYRYGTAIDGWNAWQARAALAAAPAPAPEPFDWPKLDKPAKVGGGTFAAGVSARLVVEAAQRQHEYAEAEVRKTPEEAQQAERARRELWDMLNGAPAPHPDTPDAERYRKLVASGKYTPSSIGGGWALACSGEPCSRAELDAAADALPAARAQAQKGGEYETARPAPVIVTAD